jgi:triosephosphate isomerase (TIM)
MTNRKPFIAGNWKMYKTIPEAVETAGEMVKLLKDPPNVEVMIAPSYVLLTAVAREVEKSCISMGAQDLYWEKEGAYTGATSAAMLVSAGCEYVIIGHSERRQYFAETDHTVNLKIRAAIEGGLAPILCVGETEIQRESQETFSIRDKQIQMGLKDFSRDELEKLVIAYEPVWAIGTGKTATTPQVQEVHEFLRNIIENNFGNSIAKNIRILYGGSVKPENITELMAMPDVDGALVGGASLNADTFVKIVSF